MSKPAMHLARLPQSVQWLVLIAGSALLVAIIMAFGLPAALLLGSMLAGIALATNGVVLRVPHLPYLAAQAIVGLLIAGAITPDIVRSFAADWLLFVSLVLTTVAASSVLGYFLSRWRVLPGTAGVWGSSPGGATAMVLMAEAFGADHRLVAFMQYLRVVCVALAAALIARFWVHATGSAPAVVWFPPVNWLAFAETLSIAGIGALVGVKLRLPSGAMLGPMIGGAILHASGVVEIELPEWLLAATYAIIGWRIGFGFTREVLAHASRAFPRVLGSILILMAFCGGLSVLLSHLVGVDPLTAYLATSPGGLDSIAIIAASSHIDLPFVMSLQAVRFFIVVLLGPPIARLIARRTSDPDPAPQNLVR